MTGSAPAAPDVSTLRASLSDLLKAYDAWVAADGAPAGDTGAALAAKAAAAHELLGMDAGDVPPADGDAGDATADARDDLLSALHDELHDHGVPIAVLTVAVDRALKVTDFAAVAGALGAADQVALAAVAGVSGPALDTAQTAWRDARGLMTGPARFVIAVETA